MPETPPLKILLPLLNPTSQILQQINLCCLSINLLFALNLSSDTANLIQIEMTSNVEKPIEPHLHHVVKFHSKHTFVGLPVLHAYSSLNIFFQLHESNCLILYNSGWSVYSDSHLFNIAENE